MKMISEQKKDKAHTPFPITVFEDVRNELQQILETVGTKGSYSKYAMSGKKVSMELRARIEKHSKTLEKFHHTFIGKDMSVENLQGFLKCRTQEENEPVDHFSMDLISAMQAVKCIDQNACLTEKTLIDAFVNGINDRKVSSFLVKYTQKNDNINFFDVRRLCLRSFGLKDDIIRIYEDGKLIDLNNPPHEETELLLFINKLLDLIYALKVRIGVTMLDI